MESIRMKKLFILTLLLGVLAACGSGGTNETDSSEKQTKVSSSVETSSSKKKSELKEVDFQLEGTKYKVKILDNWEVLQDEEFAFSASDEETTDGLMIYGLKKTDVDGFDTFKNKIREQITSTEEFQINEETVKEEPYQTTHYKGVLYDLTGNSEGMNGKVRFYILETETDYVVINMIGLPSFFERNSEVVDEMLNSFVVV